MSNRRLALRVVALVGLVGLVFPPVQIVLAQEVAKNSFVEEVVVIAHPLSAEGLSQASDSLSGEELERKAAANIGETLAREAGVHSASFGSAVGRPVIHGLGGPRVRVMEDRIDALDVSVVSTDHAVTVEPFIANSVEILKGPSTLLYGSGAIGGVVDVHTGRIPHDVPDAMNGKAEIRYDHNTNGMTNAFKIGGGSGGFAWHLDGVLKDGDEYEIPGFAESAGQRRLEEEEEEEEEGEHHEEEEAFGDLPGSEFDFKSYAGGASLIRDWGFVGLSVSRTDAEYGLPGGHGHHEEEEGEEEEEEEHGEEGNPILDMEQTRIDLELGVDQDIGIFSGLNVRLGVNDYEHMEIEPEGEVATEFENKAWELRTELLYEGENWDGVVGLQHTDREFSAIGEEAFVAPVDTLNTGLFALGERSFDGFDLETGIRLGRVDHAPDVGSDEDFTTFSASLGFVIPLSDAIRLGLVGDVSSRAPVAEELYSDGPHLATGTFEVGNPDLDNEQAFNVAATLNYDGPSWQARVTAYYTQFSDFIFQQATGEEEDELPVFVYQQDDATFFGIDAEVQIPVYSGDNSKLALTGLLDFVNAELDVSGDDDVPRIPPLRYGVGLEGSFKRVTYNISYLRVTDQDDTAFDELPTDEYTDLRAYVGLKLPFSVGDMEVFLNAKNLTNDEQRYHTSFIKDFAPAPGRTIEAGVRVSF